MDTDEPGAPEARGTTRNGPPAALGPAALKALAHPLRIQILDLLATHSALTASGLAELVGESSGSTSYHLRQLAKHGFVQEVTDRGTQRERWWERRPGGFTVELPESREDTAAVAATAMVNREFETVRARKIQDFIGRATELDRRWLEGARLTTASIWLTSDQLAQVSAAWEEFEKVLEPFRDQDDAPGARPVQIHFNAFPLVDGKENPS